MTTVQTRLVSLALGGWLGLLAGAACLGVEPSPVASVRPMVGTAEHGHTYPGATVPFGMVQLSPDTRLTTWDGCSGYHYSDKEILGFSHTHISGTGCGDMGDIRITPLGETPQPLKKDGYHCPFSHKDEVARPGYYSVLLQEPKVKVELTAASHAGFHRYSFSDGNAASLLVDLTRGIANNSFEAAAVVEKHNTVLSGYRRSKGWARDKTCFFVAEFSRPFDSFRIDVDGGPVDAHEGQGHGVRVLLNYKKTTEPILVKIGISAVSVEAARKNLAAEIPGWDFQATAAAAEQSWGDVLGRVEIDALDPATRETFYTALYHACLAPTLYNDADGSYRGMDRKAHAPQGFQNYCTFSLWDTFRAEHPLLTIVEPQRVDDFIRTMLAHYRQFGQHYLPVWPLAGNETWCMVGNHAIPVIADAYLKGFRGFDAEAAYQAMRDTAMQDRSLLDEYRKYGYVPSAAGGRRQSVSRTLEYVYDDWCIAEMARKLGKADDAALFAKRAENYRNVFDPSVGFARGKTVDGRWTTPFDPRRVVWADYTEGTSWNYTWFVLHDLPGLIKILGGDKACVDKLDTMFNEDSKLLAAIPDLTGLIGQYIHGNEPCHHIAYLYNYAGAPWKTQERIRQVMTTLYNNKVDGLCGNEDCGQMSAWYVLSALGFYPVNPASGVYVLGSPLVTKATIHLDSRYHKGRAFTLVAQNNLPKNVYIQSATLNGRPLSRSWFTHAELSAGGQLVLVMGPRPNPAWGQKPEDRPPSSAY
jgi:predicted alpha-1,2-mannosidase